MVTVEYIAPEKVIQRKKVAHLLEDKSLIVEFVGPTGSGKTTNCFYFSEFFKSQNLTVATFSDVKNYLYKLPFHQRMILYLRTLFTGVSDSFSFVLLLAHHGIYSMDSIYRYIKLRIFNTALYEFTRASKVNVVLLDQWIIQGLWSATIFKTQSFKSLQHALKKFYFKTDYALYFDIDEETACQRIQSRNSGRSRFDRMGKVKPLAEMKRYNQYLHELFERSECENKFEFSTRLHPAENAELFIDRLTRE